METKEKKWQFCVLAALLVAGYPAAPVAALADSGPAAQSGGRPAAAAGAIRAKEAGSDGIAKGVTVAAAGTNSNGASGAAGTAGTAGSAGSAAGAGSASVVTDDAEENDSDESVAQQLKELKRQVEKLRKEAEARKRLEVSEEEKEKKAEAILSAAGREYTLLKEGALSLEYSLNYSYFSGDVIKSAALVEQRSNHNIINQIYTEYGIRDNLSANVTVPFAYKYNRVGTDKAQEATDFGDLSVGLQVQPLKAGAGMPAMIFSAALGLPFGSSPYKINPDTSLATGAGFYSLSSGVSLSKTLDPLVAFGNLGYTYNFDASGLNQNWSDGRTLTSVSPGSSVTLAMGFGYALSYLASLNLSFQAAYNFSNEYHFSNADTLRNGSTVSGSFNIGTGWRIMPTRSISLKLGIGLTSNDPDFSVSLRVPFEF